MELDKNNRYQAIKNITITGALINLLLAALKITFGWIGRSNALFADGIHSFSDLLTDLLVIVATYFGSKAADVEHPYGHARIETAATMVLALMIILAGIGIIIDGVAEMVLTPVFPVPNQYVLLVAALSIFLNEFLFRYSLVIAERTNSSLLTANAWHHRSDAASSVVVFIGVGLSLSGFGYLDVVAAIIVGLMIIKMGVTLGWSSVRELVDTGLVETTVADIERTIKSVPGVLSIHKVRTRTMGNNILIDVHVQVAPKLSVSEGHFISGQVHIKLCKSFPKITDVTVHIDAEPDDTFILSSRLPGREQLLPELIKSWASLPGKNVPDKITLHYLAGKLYIEVKVPAELANDQQELSRLYQQATSHLPFQCTVSILFV